MTVIKEEGTAMSKLVNAMALYCSVYNTGLRNLAERHEFDERENSTEKVDIVLAEAPYKAGRARNNDHALYNVPASKDTKITTKVSGDVIKIKA